MAACLPQAGTEAGHKQLYNGKTTNRAMEGLQGLVESQQIEIEAKQSQIESLAVQTLASQSEVEALRAEVRRLSLRIPQTENSDKDSQRQSCPRPLSRVRTQSQPNILHPQAKLQWKEVGNLPRAMNRAQVVVIGDKVYVGGGSTDRRGDSYLIFQYNSVGDEWSTLPPCPVRYFGLAQLSGELLTVGGAKHNALVFGKISGKVYRYQPASSKKWKKSLQPMPTARFCLSVVSTQSALIACGGTTGFSDGKPELCTSVEVYVTETSQWHTADSLCIPCDTMSSATISGTAYLLGRFTTDNKPTNTAMYAPVASLIQKAISHPQQSSGATRDNSSSIWKTIQDAPLYGSAAANLGGALLTIGGRDDKGKSPAVYIYTPTTDSWRRIGSGDLPEVRYDCIATDLAANRLLVIGGRNESNRIMNTVFLGLLKFGF